jgi:hypothetical protein
MGDGEGGDGDVDTAGAYDAVDGAEGDNGYGYEGDSAGGHAYYEGDNYSDTDGDGAGAGGVVDVVDTDAAPADAVAAEAVAARAAGAAAAAPARQSLPRGARARMSDADFISALREDILFDCSSVEGSGDSMRAMPDSEARARMLPTLDLSALPDPSRASALAATTAAAAPSLAPMATLPTGLGVLSALMQASAPAPAAQHQQGGGGK